MSLTCNLESSVRSIEAASNTASVSSSPEEARLVELLLRELYVHGSLEMSSACLRVLALALTSAQVADQAKIQSVFAQTSAAFARLAQHRFVQRLPDLAVEDDAMDGTGGKRNSSRRVPLFVDPTHQQNSKHWIPSLNIPSKWSHLVLCSTRTTPSVHLSLWLSTCFCPFSCKTNQGCPRGPPKGPRQHQETGRGE